MSDMERNKGKLIKTSMSVVEFLYPDVDIDDLEWETDGKYVCISGQVYEVVWEIERDTDCSYFVDVKVNDDGSIDFHTYHYNGSAHWTELLEGKLK